jgi:hypothetical protein
LKGKIDELVNGWNQYDAKYHGEPQRFAMKKEGMLERLND